MDPIRTMRKPTIEQIAETLYQTMPLVRRDQRMDAAKSIYSLFIPEKTRKVKDTIL